MKFLLNNKTPVLTEEDDPSWNCTKACCFYNLLYGKLSCSHFSKQCTEGYSYTLQDNISNIFKL